MDLVLKEKLANVTNYKAGRIGNRIEYIVIHYTANDGDTDEGNASYFARPGIYTSAHWFVDEDSATRSVKEENTAWQCGGGLQGVNGHAYFGICTNSNSIGVEMCSDKVNGQFVITEKTVQNTVELVKYLMNKYNIPISNIIRHHDVTGKNCPAPWVADVSKWNDFKLRLNESAIDTQKRLESQALITQLQKVVSISDTKGLLEDLIYYHNGSSWWVIKKLLAKDFTQAKAIIGKLDIYRRTLVAVQINEPVKYNSELLNIGNDSIFWVIKKLLDGLGIE